MIKIKTLNKLFTTNTLVLFKRIKTLLTTSLTTLFLGLSSLFPYQAFSTTDSESLPIIDTSALVGSTTGALSIGQGAANYAIPITVPPGISGMKPELSINYNSNSGNGISVIIIIINPTFHAINSDGFTTTMNG
jgi:hypothetical protein